MYKHFLYSVYPLSLLVSTMLIRRVPSPWLRHTGGGKGIGRKRRVVCLHWYLATTAQCACAELLNPPCNERRFA